MTMRAIWAIWALFFCGALPAQEWPHYGGDAGGTRYSPLKQIHRGNVAKLQVAWTYDTGDFSDATQYPSRSAFEATPLVVDGVMYIVTPFCRLIALDPETGKELWAFDPKIDRSVRVNLFLSRGASFWTDGKAKRILLGDLEGRLWSIDAVTGKPDPAFGREGVVDLKEGFVEKYPNTQYRSTSPVAICGDVAVAGSLVSDGAPKGPSGDVRGIDVRTGKVVWRFGVIDPKTFEGGSHVERGGANMWAPPSADPANGLVFLPLTSASYDFYGGDRKGANLYSDSVVALSCRTGEKKWHFQTVHHDIWDYDLPAQPSLVTVKRNGRDVPAVAQITKMGFAFVLHRLTGEPLFPVEERPVPRSAIPGEVTWPTQPYPVKPPPFARQSMRADELTTVTPESRKECLAMTEGAILDTKLYDPLGEKNQVLFPGLNGGANWGGASYDPNSRLLFVNSMDVGGLFRLVKRPEGSAIPYALRAAKHEFFWDSQLYPCQQPPWGALTAIDLNTGEFRWRVTLGEFDELTARGIAPTGAPNIGGSIATAGGLLFIAATNDGKFRAFDTANGKELWMTRLPASGFATPATYRGKKTGRQFVVIAAGGGNKYDRKFTGKLVAYALP
jgi:quinoprotein glucose dehydrogenase